MIGAQSLKNDDIVLFLPNILRNGEEGNMIIGQEFCSFEDDNGSFVIFVDDKRTPLFKILKETYWKQRQNGGVPPFRFSTSYFSYALLNGNYTIIKFGKTIHEKITQDSLIKQEYFKIQTNIQSAYGPYLDFNSSHFTGEYGNVSKEFLLNRSFDIEKIHDHLKWTNKNILIKIQKFLKKNNINITEIQNKIRSRKLKRIIVNLPYGYVIEMKNDKGEWNILTNHFYDNRDSVEKAKNDLSKTNEYKIVELYKNKI